MLAKNDFFSEQTIQKTFMKITGLSLCFWESESGFEGLAGDQSTKAVEKSRVAVFQIQL